MEIILGKTAGFCGGVQIAVQNSEKDLNKYKKVYCLGELVHNKQVIENLENKGLTVIDDISKAKERVIIRAHGVQKEIYEQAQKMGIELLDYTCKKVLLIHDLVENYSNKGYYIVLIGEPNHPEVVGTYSFCGEHKYIINKIEDVDNLILDIKKSNLKKVLIVAQTTFNSLKFDQITQEIENKIDNNIQVEINKTICNATELRQKETIELSKKVDLMIIIGGKKSSNTNKLYEISKKYCKNSIIVETYKEIDKKFVDKFEKIGIMAGASTPKQSIEEVIEYIKTSI